MPIVIAPNIPPPAAQSATPAGIVLQPGSVISAQVVQILGNDQARIAIGGQSIDVLSQVPLQAGQTLQLQVSLTASGVSLAVVNPQGAAAASQNPADATSITLAPDAAALITAPAISGAAATNSQLTPLETLAVSQVAQTAATQQTSLAPLFANLGAAASLPGLPPQLQQAIAEVLSQQTSLDQNLSGNDIKQAFQSSGLFLEASLASGSALPSSATPDLKAALIVLRQALATSLADLTSAGTTGAAILTPATQQNATPATVLQVSTSPEAASQSDATSQGATPAIAAQLGTTPTAATLAQVGQFTVQTPSQPITIIAEAETLLTISPSIAPQPTAATGSPTSTVSSKAAAPVIAQENLDLAASSQIVSPASTPAVAAARAAAGNAALNLLQEVLQAGPLAAGNPSRLVLEIGQLLSLIPVVTGARTGAIDDTESSRTNLPPPPFNGALPAAQPVAPATLAAHVSVEASLQHLLSDTDGAIARQTLLQIASLPGQTDPTAARADVSAPRWSFEIPFATPGGTAVAQFEISRDNGGNNVEPAKRIWRARFSLNVEPAGPVHALVSLNGERTSVRMWAERPATASQLRAGVLQLSQALSRADLQPGDIVVRDGAPVQPARTPAGHFLDRAL
jgi:Flagellar hook-length control protein FliK